MSLNLSLESIILLLVFIAPGFVYTRTYTAYRPRYYRDPTTIEQFVRAIVGSTVIHAVILTVVALGTVLYWGLTGHFLYLSNIIDPAAPVSDYPLPVLALFAVMGGLYLAISLILARRFASFLGPGATVDRPRWWKLILGEDPPEPFLLWHTMLQIEPLRLNLIPPRLAIQMRNGEYFEGDLYRMRLVGDEENTVELALRSVYQRAPIQNKGDISSQEMRSLTNQVLLLKSTDILWLTRNDIPS